MRKSRRDPCAGLLVYSLAGVIGLFGCGVGDQTVATYPVTGQLHHNGQPAAGAKLLMFLASDKLRSNRIPIPQAVVDKNGDFTIGCFGQDDGAPAGDYEIAIVWREESKTSRGDRRPPDRLQGRYSNPRQSGLSAKVVESGNTLPPIHLN